MQYSIDYIDIILILAAGQGLFLGVLIFHKHREMLANRFLGAEMIVYSIILLHLSFSENAMHLQYPFLMSMATGLALLIAPLHYLYATYLISDVKQFQTKDLLHLSYYAVYLVLTAILAASGNLVYEDDNLRDLPLRFVLFNWVLVLQCLTYMFLTLIKLNRYKSRIKNVFSNIEKIKLNWLHNITVIITIGLLFFLVENILYLFEIKTVQIFDFSSVIAALMFYTLGYMGLLKTQMFSEPLVSESIHQLVQMESLRNKYSKSGLDQPAAEHIRQKLVQLMAQEAPYTDSSLTLNSLARMLRVTPHNLSQVINVTLNQNFFDFINHYRVAKVRTDIADPKKSNLTFLALAYEAGFNSKSAFNLVFKKHTGVTPSEYKKGLNPRD